MIDGTKYKQRLSSLLQIKGSFIIFILFFFQTEHARCIRKGLLNNTLLKTVIWLFVSSFRSNAQLQSYQY